MQLAVSNIAWPSEDSPRVYSMLSETGVSGLEIAPGMLFPREADPLDPSEAALNDAASHTAKAGLTLVSMQSLLFGVQGAALFGGEEACAAFERGMSRAIDLAARLKIHNLVVGSPKNRVIPDTLDRSHARQHAMQVFRRLGDHAQARNCLLAIEPNPEVYGTNFLNDLIETSAFVRETGHPAVTMNLDIGAVHINGEFDRLPQLLDGSIDLVSHVHISEPQLAPVRGDSPTLTPLFDALREAGWEGWVSIEMRAVPEDNLNSVRRAVEGCLSRMAGH